MERRGPLALLYSRRLPGMPFTSINYAAGMTVIRAREFVIATATGILPNAYLLVALGGSITHPPFTKFIVRCGLRLHPGAGLRRHDRLLRRDARPAVRQALREPSPARAPVRLSAPDQ
jgi:uncharacterized membrane protein YdjX (TVP38/TMEM64 family)